MCHVPLPSCHQCGCSGLLRQLWDPHAPALFLLPTGGKREARRARQGWRAREGRRGGDAWEDGRLLLTLSRPRGSPTRLSLACLQLRLRAVLLVPGHARTFGPCRSQGRARGCWSPRAGECRAAFVVGSFPSQDEGEHPCAVLLTCPLSSLCSRLSLALPAPKARR